MDTFSLDLFPSQDGQTKAMSHDALISLLKKRKAVMEEVAKLNGLNPTFVYHEELEAP